MRFANELVRLKARIKEQAAEIRQLKSIVKTCRLIITSADIRADIVEAAKAEKNGG
jgi:hypothetical protein